MPNYIKHFSIQIEGQGQVNTTNAYYPVLLQSCVNHTLQVIAVDHCEETFSVTVNVEIPCINESTTGKFII